MPSDIPRIHPEYDPSPHGDSLAELMDVVAADPGIVQAEIDRAKARGQRLVDEFVGTMEAEGIASATIRDSDGVARFGGWIVAYEKYRGLRQVSPQIVITTGRAIFKGPVQDAPRGQEYQPLNTGSPGLDLVIAAGALRHLERYSGRRLH